MTFQRQTFRVHLVDRDEPLDVTPINPDLVRYDMTAQKHQWGGGDQRPILFTTFIAWAAAKREGLYAGSWDDWSERDCLNVEPLGATDVDPTQRVAELASASSSPSPPVSPSTS